MGHALLSPSNAKQWTACTACAVYSMVLKSFDTPAASRGTQLHKEVTDYILSSLESSPSGELNWADITEMIDNMELPEADKESVRVVIEELQKTYSSDLQKHNRTAVDTLERLPIKVDWKVRFGKALGVKDVYAFGTLDYCHRVGDVLRIIDFKFGRIAVDAAYNLQLALYAMSILDAEQAPEMLEGVKEVKAGIFQPYEDTETSETKCKVSWSVLSLKYIKKRSVKLGKKARRIVSIYTKGRPLTKQDYNPDCQYCNARGIYNPLLTEAAQQVFNNPGWHYAVPQADLGAALAIIPKLEKFIKEVQQQAMVVLENRGSIRGFELRPGRAKAKKWRTEDVDFIKTHLPEGISLTVEKLRTPADILKDLKKTESREFIENFQNELTVQDAPNKIIVPVDNIDDLNIGDW